MLYEFKQRFPQEDVTLLVYNFRSLPILVKVEASSAD